MLHTSSLHHRWRPMSPGNWKRLIILLSCVLGGDGVSPENKNPHRPVTLTWQVLSQTGHIVWETQAIQPSGTWWPSLKPDWCALAAGLETWDIPDADVSASAKDKPSGSNYGDKQVSWGAPGCSYPKARARIADSDFYVCPRDGRTPSEARRCGGLESLYCKEWGCETTGAAYWNPTSSWDLITVRWDNDRRGNALSGLSFRGSTNPCDGSGWCNPLKIDFTAKGKAYIGWVKGRTWGLRLYRTGHPGVLMTVRLKITSGPTIVIGPDSVLAEQGPPQKPSLSLRLHPSPPPADNRSTPKGQTTPDPPAPTTGDRLFGLIQGAFLALNATDPEATKSCWLCLALGPPYYEGIASSGGVVISTNQSQCRWEAARGKLTLTEVSGYGLCIGRVPSTHQHLCNQTLAINSSQANKYLYPSNHGWWSCNTGLTPCISTSIFNQSRDFCVQVQLIPRVYYHSDEALLQVFNNPNPRHKREPVSLTLAALLGLGIAAGIGTGSAALIKGPIDLQSGLTDLQAAIDTDLQALQDSISKLESSLTSLSEVVLQNRRGLDLLFLKEGGLCAALKEECCFYVDHSGAVRESMNKLKERLNMRQLERQKTQSWYEGWFNSSPWYTTLLSAITGPLLLLLLLLTIGPCIINRLVQFINNRVSAVKILVLRQKYQVIDSEDNL
uniref:Envelope protein n=1 Tax=Macroglossus minimus gammaretrovirus TaxID=2730657 RepID=A0A6M5E1S4_9GAMR|nr:envelope protein [Macroglossus minimus gammaretrovirus]